MAEEFEIVEVPEGVLEAAMVAGNYIFFTDLQGELKKIKSQDLADYVKGLIPVPTLPSKIYSSSTTELTESQLNTTYPNAKQGDKVYVKAVNREYEKLDNMWAKKPINAESGYVDAQGYDLNLLNS